MQGRPRMIGKWDPFAIDKSFLECSCKIGVFNAEGDNVHTQLYTHKYRYLFLSLLTLFP